MMLLTSIIKATDLHFLVVAIHPAFFLATHIPHAQFWLAIDEVTKYSGQSLLDSYDATEST
jgi:hypothetical protein